jgi:hypothetical protein
MSFRFAAEVEVLVALRTQISALVARDDRFSSTVIVILTVVNFHAGVLDTVQTD